MIPPSNVDHIPNAAWKASFVLGWVPPSVVVGWESFSLQKRGHEIREPLLMDCNLPRMNPALT